MLKKDRGEWVTKKALAKEVKVLGEHHEMIGIMPLGEAWKVARERGLDLEVVTSSEVPPVYKLCQEWEGDVSDRLYDSAGNYIRRLTPEEIAHHGEQSRERVREETINKALTRLIVGGLLVFFVIVGPLCWAHVPYSSAWWVVGTYLLTLTLAYLLVRIRSLYR